MEKPIAAISMVRNDTFFADKWISYYGAQLGYENLYLFVDGMEQPLPKEAKKINCFQIPHTPYPRAEGDKKRADKISEFAQSLYPKYHAVLAMDIDEFLVVDPKTNLSLKAYLQQNFTTSSRSALGLDVGQHPRLEQAIEMQKPFLSQRSFAQVSDRYTKPVVSLKPLRWGSGFHRIKGKNFTLDPNLYLFHFGLVDLKHSQQKTEESELLTSGWKGHFDRRFELYNALEQQFAQEADPFFEKARTYFSNKRKWYAWNKPAPLKIPSVIKIPKRFQTLV
jgi:hypothetical protein